MLILTRRIGETLIIGDDITITILSLKGNQVRVGINAPKEISVHRKEIYMKIKKEKNLKYLDEKNNSISVSNKNINDKIISNNK